MAATSTAASKRTLQLDDVDLELFEAGDGPPLLALHGLLELPGWQEYHERLAQRFHVVAPSHPGFAGSTRPDWMEGVDDLAYFYLDLIDTLGLGPANVVGHSLGGWIAAEMAVRCPGALRKLVLADAVGIRPVEEAAGRPGGYISDWLVLEPEPLRKLAWHDPASGGRLKLPGEEATSDEELAAIISNRVSATVYGWRPFFYNPRLLHWLKRISVPTLVVWGRHDGVVPLSAGEAYARRIPNARLEVLEGAAHLPHLELPDEFSRLAADFLS
jgi:pimeloyl-ACP methyl ester carboxylesterase